MFSVIITLRHYISDSSNSQSNYSEEIYLRSFMYSRIALIYLKVVTERIQSTCKQLQSSYMPIIWHYLNSYESTYILLHILCHMKKNALSCNQLFEIGMYNSKPKKLVS